MAGHSATQRMDSLGPDAGLAPQTRSLRPAATAPATGRSQRGRGPLGRCVGNGSARRASPDRGNGVATLRGLGPAGKLLPGRRATRRGGARAVGVLANSTVEDSPAAGRIRLRAGGAVRPRPDVLGHHLASVGFGVGGDAAANIVRQGRGTTKAGGTAVGGNPSPDNAIFIDEAALLRERPLLVEGAPLAGNQVASLLFRHTLRRGVRNIGENSYTQVIVSLGPQSRQ